MKATVYVSKMNTEQVVDVYAVIIAWVVTFTILVVVMLSLGFGALGIVAGVPNGNIMHHSLHANLSPRIYCSSIPRLDVWRLHPCSRRVCHTYQHGDAWDFAACCCALQRSRCNRSCTDCLGLWCRA